MSTVLDAEVVAGSAPPAPVHEAVPTPTRRSERHASRVANSDVRPFGATGSPVADTAVSPTSAARTEAVSAALLAALRCLVTFYPFMFVPILLNPF